MDFLGHIFNREAKPRVPQTYLREADVLFILGCWARDGETEEHTAGNPESGPYARYEFRNNVAGDGMVELEIKSRHPDGAEYASHVRARQIAPGTLDMESIVFDNEPEKLRNAKEIYDVLNWLGNQVRWIANNHLPAIHENKGRFSPLGRFMTRIMPKPSGEGFF
ncbi:MAG TPA: hypothetical protein VL625_11560 [Patescibacteria group bacterium]|nr:hypothetical protein [Patescibacteria group bacterium]